MYVLVYVLFTLRMAAASHVVTLQMVATIHVVVERADSSGLRSGFKYCRPKIFRARA